MPQEPGPWLSADSNSDTNKRLLSTTALPRSEPAFAVSSLFNIILSECLPWVGTMKHRFKSPGHINVQAAYAFRSICRRAPSRCRFVTLQDSLVNLSIEAKGRSSSPALNRIILQTWAEVLFRGQVPRGLHAPTWSLRADEPSRDKPVRPPRMKNPSWLWLLLSKNTQARDAGAAEISRLPNLSRAEVRWMALAIPLASARGLLLGRGRRAEAARPGGHPTSSPAGAHSSSPREAAQDF